MAVNVELMLKVLEKRIAYLERTVKANSLTIKETEEGRSGKVLELGKAAAALNLKVNAMDKILIDHATRSGKSDVKRQVTWIMSVQSISIFFFEIFGIINVHKQYEYSPTARKGRQTMTRNTHYVA